MTCEECATSGYTVVDGVITDLGKFERESLATYHAYHIATEGFPDEFIQDGDTLYERVENVILRHRSDGFVIGEEYDDSEGAASAFSRISDEIMADSLDD